MKKVIVLYCWVILFVTYDARADEREVLLERLKNEIPSQYNEYVKFTKHLRGRIVEKSIDGRTKKVIGEQKIELKNSGDLALSKWERTGLKGYGSYAIGRNSYYSFRVEKRANRPSWVLTEWTPNDAPPTVETTELRSIQGLTTDWLTVAYGMFDQKLPQFIANPAFRIKGARYVNGKETGLVRIDFEHRVEEDKISHPYGQPLDGWMLLDANHYWHVREYDLFHKGQTEIGIVTRRRKAHYNCEIAPNGMPIPRQLATWFMLPTAAEGEWYQEEVRECTVTAHNGLPESEFTLPAFGLPEPYGATAKKAKPLWWLWSVLAAMLFALMALYFYKRKERASTKVEIRPGGQ